LSERKEPVAVRSKDLKDFLAKGTPIALDENMREPDISGKRATCNANAAWVTAFIADAPADKPVRIDQTTESNDWLNYFHDRGFMRVDVVLAGDNAKQATHTFVIEVLDGIKVRLYQSYVTCFTLRDFLTPGLPNYQPVDGIQNLADNCDFSTAYKTFGGGKIVDGGVLAGPLNIITNAIIDANNNPLPKNAKFLKAHTETFGVDISNLPFEIKESHVVIQHFARSPKRCETQELAWMQLFSKTTSKKRNEFRKADLSTWEASVKLYKTKQWYAAAATLAQKIKTEKGIFMTETYPACSGAHARTMRADVSTAVTTLATGVDTTTTVQLPDVAANTESLSLALKTTQTKSFTDLVRVTAEASLNKAVVGTVKYDSDMHSRTLRVCATRKTSLLSSKWEVDPASLKFESLVADVDPMSW